MATVTNQVGSFKDSMVDKGHSMIDALVSREKQSEWLEWLKTSAIKSPKLAAFLLINILLSGGPLVLFIIFTITTFVFSLIAALLIGLVAALLFVVFMLLVALFVVLPTVFLTTLAATFVFLWGLGGFYVISWLNRTGKLDGEGKAIGDKLNNFSGGRLDWLMSDPREKSQDMRESDSKDEEDSSVTNSGNGLSGETISGAAQSANGKAGESKETAKAAEPDSTATN